MTNRFEGKTALIAGGTGGLGRAVTVAFLQEGARVGVTYRAEQELQSLQAAAGTNASFLTGWRADVTNEKEMADVVQKIGSLDILVNAVGGYAGGTALWDTASETFERMMLLNVRSGFVLARLIVPAAVDHAAGASAYAASKAAAVAMMDSLAADVLGHGVRVNTVLPSIIDTEANRKAMPGADFTKWPKPEEIARVILFLCSDDAKLIHGASIPVYGANG
jgi:NAD(P)-dependent dehydrogenase (short-subunit alcohol dehydrogenase family)